MPLGNGRLGVAIWASGGLTLQLNRADTLPGRLSPGEVVFEGLAPMVADRQFRGRLDLFNGEWRQTGAGASGRDRNGSRTGFRWMGEKRAAFDRAGSLWQGARPVDAVALAIRAAPSHHAIDSWQRFFSVCPGGQAKTRNDNGKA